MKAILRLKAEIMAGAVIDYACRDTYEVSLEAGCPVDFEFNGVKLTSDATVFTVQDVADHYYESMNKRGLNNA